MGSQPEIWKVKGGHQVTIQKLFSMPTQLRKLEFPEISTWAGVSKVAGFSDWNLGIIVNHKCKCTRFFFFSFFINTQPHVNGV